MKHCYTSGCINKPSYMTYDTKLTYCKICKNMHPEKEKMISIRHKQMYCIVCHIKRANFNFIGLPGKYCEKCKFDHPDGKHMFNVNRPLCKQDNCFSYAKYNYDGNN